MSPRRFKKLRVIVLMQEELMPPETLEGVEDKRSQPWRTEYDVVSTLRAMGHEAWSIGVGSELGIIRKAIHDHKPHVAFNLLEEFDGYPLFDQHVVSFLELMKQQYTGCNPRGLTLARRQGPNQENDGIPPNPRAAFCRVPVGPQRPFARAELRFPLFVKSLSDEGSAGIAQASVVRDNEKLKSVWNSSIVRIRPRRSQKSTLKGREIYVGVIGNQNSKLTPRGS